MIAESVKLRKRKCSEKSGSEKPRSKKPGSEKPGSEKPRSEKPGSEKPGFEIPGSEKSGSEKPGSEKSESEKTGSEKSGSEEPGSENDCHRNVANILALEKTVPTKKLQQRRKSVTENNDYHCPICGEKQAFKSYLKRHISLVHEKIKPFSCPNCQRMFSDKRGFEPHLKKCSLSMATGEI